jgi:hypothetical protein
MSDKNPSPKKSSQKETIYGNKDKEQKYPLNEADLDRVVVYQRTLEALGTGYVEVPGSGKVQTYYPDQFKKLVEQEFFADSKIDVIILHQP